MSQSADVPFSVKCIRHLHLIVTLFTTFGWMWPWHSGLLVHLIFVPLVMLQWRFNNGTCLLTNLENYLLGAKPDPDAEQGQFIKSLLSKCFDPLPSDQKIKFWLYAILWFGWGISFVRLTLDFHL